MVTSSPLKIHVAAWKRFTASNLKVDDLIRSQYLLDKLRMYLERRSEAKNSVRDGYVSSNGSDKADTIGTENHLGLDQRFDSSMISKLARTPHREDYMNKRVGATWAGCSTSWLDTDFMAFRCARRVELHAG